MPATSPIDRLEGSRIALRGRVVTMNARNRVLNNAIVYIDRAVIVAVRHSTDSPPVGFDDVQVVDTQGTIFPGLIELHNHLPYDVLPLWDIPKKFRNRAQWGGSDEYQRLITTPMTTLGSSRYVSSVIRYVECKTLLGGVTTTQGVELFSNAGVRRYYRGIVRNVEQTDDPELPEAATRIADVDAKDATRFFERLNQNKKLILHLSEGIGASVREHFLSLHLGGHSWAINENLVGIHCAGLNARDFGVMARHRASMVWSPLSNLLLYGDTADVAAAKREGVPIGLGSDWSPTGSKNLLNEIKIAHLVSNERGEIFTDRELVAMVTRDAAAILGWDSRLGSLEPNKRADLVVIEGESGDPYANLMRTDESEIRMVMINGVARAGLPSLLKRLSGDGEEITVGGRSRMLYLKQNTSDPAVGKLTLKAARERLEEFLTDMPNSARHVTAPSARDEGEWSLALDELSSTGVSLRPQLPLRGGTEPTGPILPRHAMAATNVEPLRLDEISVADDHNYIDLIAKHEMNVPDYLSRRLRRLYA